MDNENESPWPSIIGIVVVFVVLPMAGVFLSSWLSSPVDESPCRDTTREVQTIRKVDGGVTSVDTETVYGCEYPDGTFIPAPDN